MRRLGRTPIYKNIGVWRLPRPIMKYTYKQSSHFVQSWQFGWGHFDNQFSSWDFLSENLFNDSSTLSKYFSMQYGFWIINKIKIVVDAYDFSKYTSHAQRPAGNAPSDIKPDPLFVKNKMFLEFYVPNNRDAFGIPVLGDRYEFIRRVPFGKRFTHTYYPRCKKRIRTNISDLGGKAGESLIKMQSPDAGRAIMFLGLAPLGDVPTQNDQFDYLKYVLAFNVTQYIYVTFTDRNIQMMV